MPAVDDSAGLLGAEVRRSMAPLVVQIAYDLQRMDWLELTPAPAGRRAAARTRYRATIARLKQSISAILTGLMAQNVARWDAIAVVRKAAEEVVLAGDIAATLAERVLAEITCACVVATIYPAPRQFGAERLES